MSSIKNIFKNYMAKTQNSSKYELYESRSFHCPKISGSMNIGQNIFRRTNTLFLS